MLYNKDPTISGAILGSPIFRKPPGGVRLMLAGFPHGSGNRGGGAGGAGLHPR